MTLKGLNCSLGGRGGEPGPQNKQTFIHYNSRHAQFEKCQGLDLGCGFVNIIYWYVFIGMQ